MKILHGSDWHGQFNKVPEADLYIFTGDMIQNYITWDFDDYFSFGKRLIKPKHEASQQRQWMQKKGSMRKFLGSPAAPVVVVRGNHEFTSLEPLFRDGPVYEINEPTDVFEIDGLRIGGCRGVNYMVGEWSDELSDHDFLECVHKIPRDLDILVTHSPPEGILDEYTKGRHLGSPALASYLQQCAMDGKMPKAVCFGHIHEAFGTLIKYDTVFSNAATGYNVFTIERDKDGHAENQSIAS